MSLVIDKPSWGEDERRAVADAYTRGWNDAKEAAEQVVHAARGSGDNDLRTVAYRIKSLTPKPSQERGS